MKPIPINQLSIPQINATINHALQVGGQELVIRKESGKRRVEQNARLHAMLADFVKQGIEHENRKWTIEQWKRLVTIGWMTEIKDRPIITTNPSNGELVFFWEHTSSLSVGKMASLIEWVQAYGVEKGVRFSAPKWMESEYE